MSDTLQYMVAKSLEIAWDYLEGTGELGNPDRAAEYLLDTIEALIRHGERRPLLLSNKAIASYSGSERSRGCPLRPRGRAICANKRLQRHAHQEAEGDMGRAEVLCRR